LKKEFIGHFKRSADEIYNVWQTANFVFDANVLLNLYRYSSDTRKDFLNLFDKVKAQIWLPEQVAYEFLNNRSGVISEQSKAYEAAIKSVDELSKSFSEEGAHPFISHEVRIAYDIAAEAIKIEMENNKLAQEKLLTEDTIRDKIADLFEGKVGAAYSADEMSVAFEDGKKRFAQKTPPGYKDENKFKEPKNDAEKRSNFGDWILWKQLMDFAKVNEKPVIFVTNDTKEDWWLEQSGKTLGPRPELIAEFFGETGQHILIYKPERFLDLGEQNLHAKIDAKSIAEVSSERDAREQNRKERLRNQKLISQERKLRDPRMLRKREELEKMRRRPVSEEERVWRLETMGEELDETQAYMAQIDHSVARLKHLFSEAIETADHGGASEIDERLHEAMLQREDVSEQLAAQRYAFERELKS
jgi:predicted nucleic acid-binding protein